jgi:hypothetical protein
LLSSSSPDHTTTLGVLAVTLLPRQIVALRVFQVEGAVADGLHAQGHGFATIVVLQVEPYALAQEDDEQGEYAEHPYGLDSFVHVVLFSCKGTINRAIYGANK